jgi:hypothetical protein
MGTKLNGNDPGTGFYALAQNLEMLPARPSMDKKERFWVTQLKDLYEHYSGARSIKISASFHHASRRDRPSTDTARVTIRNISFKPTSRRSSHAGRTRAGRQAPLA